MFIVVYCYVFLSTSLCICLFFSTCPSSSLILVYAILPFVYHCLPYCCLYLSTSLCPCLLFSTFICPCLSLSTHVYLSLPSSCPCLQFFPVYFFSRCLRPFTFACHCLLLYLRLSIITPSLLTRVSFISSLMSSLRTPYHPSFPLFTFAGSCSL